MAMFISENMTAESGPNLLSKTEGVIYLFVMTKYICLGF